MRERGWRRASYAVQIALGLYVVWVLLPEATRLTVRGWCGTLYRAERVARERHADLEVMERQVMAEISCLPEVAR